MMMNQRDPKEEEKHLTQLLIIITRKVLERRRRDSQPPPPCGYPVTFSGYLIASLSCDVYWSTPSSDATQEIGHFDRRFQVNFIHVFPSLLSFFLSLRQKNKPPAAAPSIRGIGRYSSVCASSVGCTSTDDSHVGVTLQRHFDPFTFGEYLSINYLVCRLLRLSLLLFLRLPIILQRPSIRPE